MFVFMLGCVFVSLCLCVCDDIENVTGNSSFKSRSNFSLENVWFWGSEKTLVRTANIIAEKLVGKFVWSSMR